MTSDDRIYLEMPASFGAPIFVLAGSGDRATLVLSDGRVLTERADQIIEALIGVKIEPRQLLAILAGCVDQTASFTSAAQYADLIAVATPRARVFLQKQPEGWRPVAAESGPLLIEYSDFTQKTPGRVRLRSVAPTPIAINISLALNQTEINADVPASAFVARVPPDATPLTLEQLRQAGPLGARQK